MEKSKLKNYFLSLKFIGPNQQTRPIPIIVLGETLVALQQIINKCYLYRNKRLRPGSQLTHAERDALALRLIEYDKGFETYGFTPFLPDPTNTWKLENYVGLALQILDCYAKHDVERRLRTRRQNLVSRAYIQVRTITKQISRNIERIEITPDAYPDLSPMILNRETHEYLIQLEAEISLKEKEEETKPDTIQGFVIRLDPMENWVDISTANKKRIRVFLENRRDFRKIRIAKRNAVFEFTGNPIWKIGSDTKELNRFVASKVTRLKTMAVAA